MQATMKCIQNEPNKKKYMYEYTVVQILSDILWCQFFIHFRQRICYPHICRQMKTWMICIKVLKRPNDRGKKRNDEKKGKIPRTQHNENEKKPGFLQVFAFRSSRFVVFSLHSCARFIMVALSRQAHTHCISPAKLVQMKDLFARFRLHI